jgi:hypothetical protein
MKTGREKGRKTCLKVTCHFIHIARLVRNSRSPRRSEQVTGADSETKAVHNNKVMGQDLLKKVPVNRKKILR